jgi:hypothetical protein
MATWAYLNHDNCKLPTLEECEKVRAKTERDTQSYGHEGWGGADILR